MAHSRRDCRSIAAVALRGTVVKDAELRGYGVTVRVTDAQGSAAEKAFTLEVRDRPNRWFEEARLTALIHKPESLRDGEFDAFAALMKRQNYGHRNGHLVQQWQAQVPVAFDL